MLNQNTAKELLSNPNLAKKDKVLLCLSVNASKSKPVKEIIEIGISCGFQNIRKLNVSSILSRHRGLCIRSPAGWELTGNGKSYIRNLVGGPVVELSTSLRQQLVKINNLDSQRFMKEAVHCFEAHLYRAAVVLSWVGAVSLLYEHILSNHLAQFNIAASKKFTKWKAATNVDGLSRMKEADFLEVCESSSVIGKSVKQELQACLTFRNGCGHPNSLHIGEHRVSAHIESLILNVYSRY